MDFRSEIFDISAYGKLVDKVAQNFSSATVSLGTESITLQGIGEKRIMARMPARPLPSTSATRRDFISTMMASFRAAMQSQSGDTRPSS